MENIQFKYSILESNTLTMYNILYSLPFLLLIKCITKTTISKKMHLIYYPTVMSLTRKIIGIFFPVLNIRECLNAEII